MHFSGEVFICTAGEVFIHLSGAGEAGEAGEVFIYTPRECEATFSYPLMCFMPQFTEATGTCIITLESVIFPIEVSTASSFKS